MIFPETFKEIFEPGLLDEMDTKATSVFAKEGEVILDIGQTIKVVPLTLKGSLKISRLDESGKELLLYYVNARQSCVMTFTCCMQRYPSEIQVTAETDVDFIAIPISTMDQWLMKFPTWKSFVMRTIRDRFNELLQAIDQLAFQRLDERLVHYLKKKSVVTGSTLINLSHEEIANELASSREVISRILKKLENDKKVLLYRGQIKLLKEL